MIDVQVVYAPNQTDYFCACLQLPEGTTIQAAICASHIVQKYPEIEDFTVGIWSKRQSRDTVVKTGDRIEIYRPLPQSAMEARRQRAIQPKKSGLN